MYFKRIYFKDVFRRVTGRCNTLLLLRFFATRGTEERRGRDTREMTGKEREVVRFLRSREDRRTQDENPGRPILSVNTHCDTVTYKMVRRKIGFGGK